MLKGNKVRCTVQAQYISNVDVAYKHTERFAHLRTLGTRYGDRTEDFSFERVVAQFGGDSEVCIILNQEKLIPLKTLMSVLEALSSIEGQTVRLITREEAKRLVEDVEAQDEAEEKAKAIDAAAAAASGEKS